MYAAFTGQPLEMVQMYTDRDKYMSAAEAADFGLVDGNPISISAAAQLEDKRKTQAEICKVTGLNKVTLRKNWGDLLPANYTRNTPSVPPEKAFPMTMISSARSSNPKVDATDISLSAVQPDMVKQLEEVNHGKKQMFHRWKHGSLTRSKEERNTKSNCHGSPLAPLGVLDMEHKVSYNQNTSTILGSEGEIFQKPVHGIKMNEILYETCDLKQRFERAFPSSVHAAPNGVWFWYEASRNWESDPGIWLMSVSDEQSLGSICPVMSKDALSSLFADGDEFFGNNGGSSELWSTGVFIGSSSKMPDLEGFFFEDNDHGSSLPALMRTFRRRRRRRGSGAVPALPFRASFGIRAFQIGAASAIRQIRR
ncbi:hypothetical protein ACLOJK_003558 [Asimina triloba]